MKGREGCLIALVPEGGTDVKNRRFVSLFSVGCQCVCDSSLRTSCAAFSTSKPRLKSLTWPLLAS
eukprot:5423604-Amphidinium_carterae.1